MSVFANLACFILRFLIVAIAPGVFIYLLMSLLQKFSAFPFIFNSETYL